MWYQAVLDLLRDAFNVVWARSPALPVAIILLVLGWLIGRVLSTVVVLETLEGCVVVPACRFQENHAVLVSTDR